MIFRYAPFRIILLVRGLFACGLIAASSLPAAQPADVPTSPASSTTVAPSGAITSGPLRICLTSAEPIHTIRWYCRACQPPCLRIFHRRC